MKAIGIIAATALAAASFTAVPARANERDLIRLGVGIGAAIIGEAMRNQRPKQTQPQQRRQQPQARSSNRQAPARQRAAAPAIAALPAVVPIPEFRPDPEAVAAQPFSPISDPVLEAARIFTGQQHEMEVPHDVLPEVVSIEDEQGRVWGVVDGHTAVKIEQAVDLGMSRSDAIAALTDLSPPQEAMVEEEAVSVPEPVVADIPPAIIEADLAPAELTEDIPEVVAVIEEPAPEPEPEPLSLDIDL